MYIIAGTPCLRESSSSPPFENTISYPSQEEFYLGYTTRNQSENYLFNRFIKTGKIDSLFLCIVGALGR